MPLERYGCATCGLQAPKKLRAEGMFQERMSWLRKHYKKHHPKKFNEWYK